MARKKVLIFSLIIYILVVFENISLSFLHMQGNYKIHWFLTEDIVFLQPNLEEFSFNPLSIN